MFGVGSSPLGSSGDGFLSYGVLGACITAAYLYIDFLLSFQIMCYSVGISLFTPLSPSMCSGSTPFATTNIIMASWHVRTLSTSQKCSSITDLLFRNKVDIVFLQETHLEFKGVHRVALGHYAVVATSSMSSCWSGILILESTVH